MNWERYSNPLQNKNEWLPLLTVREYRYGSERRSSEERSDNDVGVGPYSLVLARVAGPEFATYDEALAEARHMALHGNNYEVQIVRQRRRGEYR